jgi:hypothetical protein
MLITFDATSRESCVVNRSRTNTPLQALALLNDVTFIEAARVMAQRELRLAAGSQPERIERLFRLLTSRIPAQRELEILHSRYLKNLDNYRQHPAAAEDLVQLGEYPVDKTLDVAELAALTTVTSVLLNLDEVITKE